MTDSKVDGLFDMADQFLGGLETGLKPATPDNRWKATCFTGIDGNDVWGITRWEGDRSIQPGEDEVRAIVAKLNAFEAAKIGVDK